MKITINGEVRIINEKTSIAGLMKELHLDPRKVAIEQNLSIIPLHEYESTYLHDGDVLEAVQFIGGG